MLNCKDVTKLVSDSFDRKLSLWERINMRVHLLLCKCSFCQSTPKEMDLIRDVVNERLKAESDSEGDHQLSTESRSKIKQMIESLNQ